METKIYSQLLTEYTPLLRAFAYRFTRDNEEINDLLQDTLVKAIRYHGQFQEGTNLKAWLCTILRNTFINEYRRNAKRNALITTEEEITSNQLYHSSNPNQAEGKFAMADIQKALNTVPEDYRTPFIRHFEGFKYHEIADELNIPIGTVKTRIHLARKILQKKLKIYNR
jgi:RNA polymerase sigma factor (sigma-70 family)